VLLAADTGTSSNSLLTFLPIVLLVVAFYFLLIRPQGKRRREALALQSKIGPGDEVQTVGGLYGTVTDVDDASVTLEAAPGVHLRFVRAAIAKVNVSHANDAVADDAEEADEVADGNADTAKAID
jgi:preprotein translocase subunit YajC